MDSAIRKNFFEALEQETQELIDPATGFLSTKFSRIVPCPLCEAPVNKHETLFIKKGYTFVRCTACGMMFSNPQVKEEYMNQLYGRSKAEDIWVELQKSDKEKTWKKDYYVDCIRLIDAFADNRKAVRLLDIGCSTGYFLELLQELKRDWAVKGLELNEKAYQWAVQKGLSVEQKLLHDIDQSETYDVMTVFGVMEHLTNPKDFLHHIVSHANGDIVVLAIVPNAYSLYHMFLREQSVSFDGRDHILFFSEVTLKKIFKMCGFEVLHLDTVLTGMDAIKKYIQWYDPYAEGVTERFIPEKVQYLLKNDIPHDFLYKHNLGLRLRIVAKYQSKK